MIFKPNPYVVFDIDVLVRKDFFGRMSLRIPSMTLLHSIIERYSFNIGVASADARRRKHLEEFIGAYGIGVQRWVESTEELFWADRSGLMQAALLTEAWRFDTINERRVLFYSKSYQIEEMLFKLQGALA